MAIRTSLLLLGTIFAAIWPDGATAERRPGTLLLPPVVPACVSSPFGPRILPNQPLAGSYHYGIDLPAPEGTPVVATASGAVIRIQHKGPGGLEILVQHDGFIGIYSHFGIIAAAFAQGKQSILAGEKLGSIGLTGVTSGAHLYFGMILGGKPVDPAPFLGVPPCDGTSLERTPIKPANARTSIMGWDRREGLFPVWRKYEWEQQLHSHWRRVEDFRSCCRTGP